MDTKMILLYAGFIAVLYFFFILPNSKKAKKQKLFLSELKKGDKIVTTGGIHGKITELKDLTATIDLGNGNKMKINRAAISLEASDFDTENSSKED
jgi:preprotein translocase subunit YajC